MKIHHMRKKRIINLLETTVLQSKIMLQLENQDFYNEFVGVTEALPELTQVNKPYESYNEHPSSDAGYLLDLDELCFVHEKIIFHRIMNKKYRCDGSWIKKHVRLKEYKKYLEYYHNAPKSIKYGIKHLRF